MSSLLRAILVVSSALLLGACAKPPSAEEVANAFVTAYFVRSDMAAAVKLTTGRARANLTATLQEIEASGAREPPKDKPRVKVSFMEKLPGNASAVEIVYRVESDVTGIVPITATLRLTREGDEWYVSDFSQSPYLFFEGTVALAYRNRRKSNSVPKSWQIEITKEIP